MLARVKSVLKLPRNSTTNNEKKKVNIASGAKRRESAEKKAEVQVDVELRMVCNDFRLD